MSDGYKLIAADLTYIPKGNDIVPENFVSGGYAITLENIGDMEFDFYEYRGSINYKDEKTVKSINVEHLELEMCNINNINYEDKNQYIFKEIPKVSKVNEIIYEAYADTSEELPLEYECSSFSLYFENISNGNEVKLIVI